VQTRTRAHNPKISVFSLLTTTDEYLRQLSVWPTSFKTWTVYRTFIYRTSRQFLTGFIARQQSSADMQCWYRNSVLASVRPSVVLRYCIETTDVTRDTFFSVGYCYPISLYATGRLCEIPTTSRPTWALNIQVQ